MIEVPVPGMKREIVLQNKRREPDIVGWNRRALLSQLPENRRVVMRRLVIGKKHSNAVFQKEPSESSLVLHLPTPERKARPKFGDHDKRQEDSLGLLQQRHRLRDAIAQINVPIRVERNPHRQRSAST